jgi:hypothetical protein
MEMKHEDSVIDGSSSPDRGSRLICTAELRIQLWSAGALNFDFAGLHALMPSQGPKFGQGPIRT